MRCTKLFIFTLIAGVAAQLAVALAPEAESAFISGKYAAAIEMTRDAQTADDAAFCARALLAQAITDPNGPTPALVNDALDHANLALSVQADHVEGRLQRAIALSLLARPMSLREARRSGYGEDARDLAESVILTDPDNVYAHGFLAVWHLEVLRRGGRLGGILMDASISSAAQHYARAAATAPDDASIHWQYARALTALNARKYSVDINRALDAALAAKIDTSLEATMQARAVVLREKLATKGENAAEDWAAETL